MNSPVIREGVSGCTVNFAQGRDSLWGGMEGESGAGSRACLRQGYRFIAGVISVGSVLRLR